MTRPVRIGNAHGFWGDRLSAAADLLAAEPELDYLTLDFLAEVSMSILALQQSRDPQAGFPRDFVEIIESLVPYFRAGGRCRIITNAGGLNPHGCARACLDVLSQAGCPRTIGVVSGDNVLELLRADATAGDAPLLRNLDTADPITAVADRLVTANAYLGAAPLVEALQQGAEIVITGRVADPSLTVAACVHHFDWNWDEWDRLAGATVAGHLIECGTQVTGGIATDWLDVPSVADIGFPIAEVADDGSCIITKPPGSGGCVTEQTVKEQLLYEIGDPEAYLSPDVTVSFLSLRVEPGGSNRVQVSGAKGRPAPETYKVSATYRDGYRAQGQLTIFGRDAVAKARRAGQTVLEQLRRKGLEFRESIVECVGTGACSPHGSEDEPSLVETALRIAVADDSREAVEQFTRELMPLITAGPQGTTGYAEGRPRVHPVFRYWPCLIERSRATPRIELIGTTGWPGLDRREAPDSSVVSGPWPVVEEQVKHLPPRTTDHGPRIPERLGDLAFARSGDKGRNANIGVAARRAEDFDWLRRELTAERIAAYFQIEDARRVRRYELPNLHALNFVIDGILANSLRVDAQGKALGQALLEMPLALEPESNKSETE